MNNRLMGALLRANSRGWRLTKYEEHGDKQVLALECWHLGAVATILALKKRMSVLPAVIDALPDRAERVVRR